MNTESTSHHFTPLKKKDNRFWKAAGLFSALSIVIGVLVGVTLISKPNILSSLANSSVVYWSHNEGQTMSFNGAEVTVHDTGHQYQLKLVVYKANQPAWGPTWQAIGSPTVTNVVDGSTVQVPCGFFQADLIPQSATVYQSPSYNGDRYGYPGDDVLKAAVNGERSNCEVSPTPTPTPVPKCGDSCPVGSGSVHCPDGNTCSAGGRCELTACSTSGTACDSNKCKVLTPTPVPPTPTPVPQCGAGCSADANCPTNHSCASGKCVLTKCLQPGVQCDENKCKELACIEPPAVANLMIKCPNCTIN